MNRDCFSAAIFSAFTFRFLVLVIQNADFNLEREHCHELTFRGVGGGGGLGKGSAKSDSFVTSETGLCSYVDLLLHHIKSQCLAKKNFMILIQ